MVGLLADWDLQREYRRVSGGDVLGVEVVAQDEPPLNTRGVQRRAQPDPRDCNRSGLWRV